MEEFNTIDTIRLYVMKAQTQKALDELVSSGAHLIQSTEL